jgi:hypothetical protein
MCLVSMPDATKVFPTGPTPTVDTPEAADARKKALVRYTVQSQLVRHNPLTPLKIIKHLRGKRTDKK